MYFHVHLIRNKCIITELQSRVDQLKQNDVRKEDEDDEERGNLLHVGNLLHFENILVKDDEQLAKYGFNSKHYFLSREALLLKEKNTIA